MKTRGEIETRNRRYLKGSNVQKHNFNKKKRRRIIFFSIAPLIILPSKRKTVSSSLFKESRSRREVGWKLVLLQNRPLFLAIILSSLVSKTLSSIAHQGLTHRLRYRFESNLLLINFANTCRSLLFQSVRFLTVMRPAP